jgi:diguanylate cyclase (GGDEF)-like protein
VGDGTDSRGQYVLLQLEDVTGERLARDELRERQLRDPLTRLATRESLAYELEISSTPRSLVVVELAELSRINGVLGPSVGDQVLVEAAQRLRACCRDGDLGARLGGAELAILLDDADGSSAGALAQRLAASLAAAVHVDGKVLSVGARIGFTADPSGSQSLESLLQRADLALHLNKAESADAWTGFEPGMLDSSARQLALESDLRLALDNGDIAVVYQPIYDVESGELRTVETLSRWTHPTLGRIEPYEFVGLAERTGQMGALVAHTLRAACADLARWRETFPAQAAGLAVSVNVSPGALGAPEFAALVANCLIDADVPAENLIIEVTETALAEADPVAVANAHKLRDLGVGLALDDFGVGYSSLSRLAQLPVTDIKLDRSFIADLAHAEVEAPIIRAVLAMARELGINVVTEGIETERQLDLVRQYRCPQAQGFLLGMPQPAGDIARLLAGRDTDAVA